MGRGRCVGGIDGYHFGQSWCEMTLDFQADMYNKQWTQKSIRPGNKKINGHIHHIDGTKPSGWIKSPKE